MEQFNFQNIIMLIGVSQGLFLAILLLLKKDKSSINIVLVIYILLMTTYILNKLLLHNDIVLTVFGFGYITYLFNMLYGPLIYLYVRSQIKGYLYLKKYDILLIIPLLIYFIYYFAFYTPKYNDVRYVIDSGVIYSEHLLEWSFEVLVTSCFYIASFYTLYKYKKGYKNTLKLKSSINIVMISIVSIIVDIILILLIISGIPCAALCNNIIILMFILMLFAFGYNEFIFCNTTEKRERKNIRKSLNNIASLNIKEKLIMCMDDKQYLDPELTLKKLASQIKVQPHILSQVINEDFEKNYSDFINSYRIKYAKKLIKNPLYKNYTLTAIGYESGFSSKSTFYDTFKKHTGKTPLTFSLSENKSTLN